MADQDAQDINQMMSASADNVVKPPRKSKFLWVVLSCVVVGVGLGVVVYQQSLKPAVKPSPTPRPTIVATPKPSPVPSAVTPQTNQVQPATNTITFPKTGKLRVYNTLNNIQMVLELTIGGAKKTITLPAKPISATVLANYGDATFDVTAGTSGTLVAYLNSTSGPKLRGWIAPRDSNNMKECGAPGAQLANYESEKAYVVGLLGGESLFEYQCWEDDDDEYNDFYMVWTYVPGSTSSVSPSPSGSVAASASPKASTTASPSPSPSPSSAAAATPTPTPSPRVTMPDTSEGTPVTGIFEVTVGTISVGLILIMLGLFGLLVL